MDPSTLATSPHAWRMPNDALQVPASGDALHMHSVDNATRAPVPTGLSEEGPCPQGTGLPPRNRTFSPFTSSIVIRRLMVREAERDMPPPGMLPYTTASNPCKTEAAVMGL